MRGKRKGAANDTSRARYARKWVKSSARLDASVRQAPGSAHLPGGHCWVCQVATLGTKLADEGRYPGSLSLANACSGVMSGSIIRPSLRSFRPAAPVAARSR
jgi:hypothetical protein